MYKLFNSAFSLVSPELTQQSDTMAHVVYMGGFKIKEEWKMCKACKYEYFMQNEECPICHQSEWQWAGKVFVEMFKIDNDTVTEPIRLQFHFRKCDVSINENIR